MTSQTWVSNLPRTFAKCRRFGHTWGDGTDYTFDYGGVVGFELYCARCSTTKIVLVTRQGVTVDNIYFYPEQYLKPKGEERVDRESLSRLVTGRAEKRAVPTRLTDRGWR